MKKTVYDFSAVTINGHKKHLSEYSGKTLLIVNTASHCGFTPQYKGLQKLYEKFNSKGFEILGFPSNQFGNQEPGTDDQIQEFCGNNYKITFPLFSKIDVNGKNEHPLYTFLKSEKSGFLGTKDIKWNFTKFLIDKKGKVKKRYGSSVSPEAIEKDIKELMND